MIDADGVRNRLFEAISGDGPFSDVAVTAFMPGAHGDAMAPCPSSSGIDAVAVGVVPHAAELTRRCLADATDAMPGTRLAVVEFVAGPGTAIDDRLRRRAEEIALSDAGTDVIGTGTDGRDLSFVHDAVVASYAANVVEAADMLCSRDPGIAAWERSLRRSGDFGEALESARAACLASTEELVGGRAGAVVDAAFSDIPCRRLRSGIRAIESAPAIAAAIGHLPVACVDGDDYRYMRGIAEWIASALSVRRQSEWDHRASDAAESMLSSTGDAVRALVAGDTIRGFAMSVGVQERFLRNLPDPDMLISVSGGLLI